MHVLSDPNFAAVISAVSGLGSPLSLSYIEYIALENNVA